MTLLLRDPDVQADAPAGETPPEAPPEVRTCPTCHQPLEADQDWCLSCGTAQPGRLAGLPGKRVTATVLTLTTLLVGGAVAASYAALNHDGGTPAATPTQIAQAPSPTPPATQAAPAPVTPPAVASTATPPAASTPPPPVTSAPVTPPASSTPVTPAPSTGSTGTGTTTGSTGTGTGTKAHTRTTTTTTTLPAPTEIKLDDTAGALYDPYHRDTAAGDPTKALDGNLGTSFPVTVAPGNTEIGAGLVVDLGKLRGLREIDLTTKTPGFKVEIYATDSEELPPDVLDTRWAHVKDVSKVGVDNAGKEQITLGGGSTKYRHLLLWFTTPPTDGTTVRVSELKVLG